MLATRQSEQAFGARTKLVGIIKEVAPTKDAEDDETLGVNDFHENYFLGLPLFMDSKMSFHNSLGRRKIGDVGFSTWNPFSIMGRLWRAIMAIRAMGIDGNLKGEGNILGGVIVVQPTKGIIYSFQEKMGEPFPYDAISEAIEGVASEGAKAATKDATIFTSGETCERKEDCA